ncbi:MAG TPA: ribosome biogenesis GTPase Der [Actinomycetes bacterium]|jgi:GTP-binding protein|nr:ribosome biogenesis GTPase Der [Actinomycetes bacterium]
MNQQKGKATTAAAGRPRAGGLPRVAVVGRPNVGKSTLVNRLLGRRAAITQEQPGVTRDRVAYEAEWSRRRFEVVDTGGWEPRATGLQARVVAQAERAMREADLVLFVVDATTGITEEDAAIATRLRRGGVPLLLVVNKVDNASSEPQASSFWSLGLGEPLAVSALHGRGAGDVLDAVAERLPARSAAEPEAAAVAIVGRPNVGKSSLLNRMAGTEVAIVDPTPGTTRDAVDSIVDRDGRRYRLVDTAGMRRSFQHAEGADYFALVRSFQAVDRADVALLVLEAPQGVTEQDQKVAVRAVEAGAGVVLVANKWDLMDDDARQRFDLDLERRLHFVGWAPLLRTSARTGRNVDKLWSLIDAVLAERGRRVPTAALNRWLEEATGRTPPPPVRGRSVKVRYVTQARVHPPEFVFFTTGPLTPAYRRFLERDLRRAFGFEGTPLRLVDRVRGRERPKAR